MMVYPIGTVVIPAERSESRDPVDDRLSRRIARRWLPGPRFRGDDSRRARTPPLRRAACPSRSPLRWCRPCRRPAPAGGHTCLRMRPLKPRIVSARSTSLPGEPVNTSATKNGCDRKPLDLARARDRQLVLFRQLVHAEDGDDILQRLVALENLLHLAGHRVVLLTHDQRREHARGRVERTSIAG